MSNKALLVKDNWSLNMLRAGAALLVVASHVRALTFVDSGDATGGVISNAFYLITSLGFTSVMIFFVLSGFWVGGSVLKQVGAGAFSWRNYLTSRLVRLWLVAIPALFATFALDEIGQHTFAGHGIYAGVDVYHTTVPVNLQATSSLADFAGNLVFLQGIFVDPFGTDTPLWSLANEFWYYILFPACVILFAPKTPRRDRLISLLVSILIIVIVGIQVLKLFPIWLLGVLVAALLPRLLERSQCITSRAMQAAAALTFASTIAVAQAFNLSDAIAACPIGISTSFFIATLAQDVRGPRRIIGTLRRISGTAHWSYSLYATHLPLLALLVAAFGPAATDRWHLSSSSIGVATLLTVILLIYGWFFSLATEAQTTRVRKIVQRL